MSSHTDELTCLNCQSGPYSQRFAYCPTCGHPLPGGGLLFSKYRLLEILGEGALSQVYRAENMAAHGRLCAIKRLGPPKQAVNMEAAQREASLLAQLNNAGISSIPDLYETFTYQLSFFVVLEFIQGRSLLEWARAAQPDWKSVVTRFIPVLQILTRLHGLPQPITHNDVKPTNMLEDHNGQIWLVDFGLADVHHPATDTSGQSSYQWSGTPRYMPWEQYQRRPTPATDVYAAALSLYQLLVSDTIFKQLPKISVNPAPGLTPENYFDPLWPAGLSEVLLQATQAEPENRPTAADFVARLENCLPPPSTAGGGLPLTLPGEVVLRQAADFVELAERDWPEARRLLQAGTLVNWLRDSLFRDDWAQAVQAGQQQVSDPDEALEQTLHILDANLPHPTLTCQPEQINLGRLNLRPRRASLCVRNPDRGCLTVTLTPSAPWLEVTPAQLTLPRGTEQTVTLTVHPVRAPGWQRHLHAALQLQTPGYTQAWPVEARLNPFGRFWLNLGLPLSLVARKISGLCLSGLLAWVFFMPGLNAALQLKTATQSGAPQSGWFWTGQISLVILAPLLIAVGALLGRGLGIGRAAHPFSFSSLLHQLAPIVLITYLTAVPLSGILIILIAWIGPSAAGLIEPALLSAGLILSIVATLLARPPMRLPRDPFENPFTVLVGPALLVTLGGVLVTILWR